MELIHIHDKLRNKDTKMDCLLDSTQCLTQESN